MAKVFVSYSRKDIEFAKRLTAELQKSELDFWIDWEGIPPTVDWWKEIEKGIEEADIFLFLISPDSAKSTVCGQEIDTAVKNGKRIIPIVVREIEWQDTPPQLGHLNYIFFSRGEDFDTAVEKLMTAIKTDYEWAAAHRRLQVKALDWERNSRENGFFLRGKDLQDAELNLARNTSKDPHPTDLQREYVFESRKATDRQRRTTTSIAVGGVVVLAALTAVAVLMAFRATRQAQISRVRELSAQSVSLREKNFLLSLLLGVEALRHTNRKFDSVQAITILLWDVETHQIIGPPLTGHADRVNSVAFSPDGKTLASGGNDGILLWDVGTHQIIGQPLAGATSLINSVVFSPDGNTLASSNNFDFNIILWNVGTQQPFDAPLSGHTGFVNRLAFSPDGQTLASGSDDGTIILWKTYTVPPTGQPLIGHTDAVTSLAFSPDSKTLASGSNDQAIMLWEVEPRQPNVRSLIEHSGLVTSTASFSPDGKTLASGSNDGMVTLWDMETGQPIGQPLTGHKDWVSSMVFSPDGKTLASGSNDGAIILWDVKTHQPIGPPLRGHSEAVTSLAFSPDGKTLASSNNEGTIILWDVETHQTIDPPLIGNSEAVTSIAFSPNGKTLASGIESGNITLWNVETHGQIGKPLTGHSEEVTRIAFSQECPSPPAAPAERCGKTLASGSSDGTLILWDMESWQPIGPPLTGHADAVSSIAFNREGKTLASGGADGTIILWDVETRQPIGQPLTADPSYLVSLAFSADSKTLVSVSDDSTFILWDVDPQSWASKSCKRAGRNFTRTEWEKYFPDEGYRKTCDQWPLTPEARTVLTSPPVNRRTQRF